MYPTARSKPILVGVDGSRHSRAALEWALREATLRRCSVHLVHAMLMASPPERAQAKRLLAEEERFAAVFAPGTQVESDFLDARAVPALIAEGAGAEMIVIGHRGRGGFASLALGSVGVQLASHAPCPLVVVRHSEIAADGPSAGRVVVGVDGSPMSEHALEFAFLEASLRGCGLTAVHASPVSAVTAVGTMGQLHMVPDADLADEQRLLAESLAGWREKYPDVDVLRQTPIGHVGYALIEKAREAQLVVVGSRGRGGFGGLLLGSTSQVLLFHAPCPVAVVRQTGEVPHNGSIEV